MEIDHWWLVLVGAAIVVLVIVDLVWTTIGVGEGRGPVSNAVARSVWKLGRAGHPSHLRLRVTGILAAVSVPTVWVSLLWLGFALMFLADEEAVVDAATQQPTSALGRIAFAAGGLAGAGASLVAGSEAWELVNNVAAILGLTLVTLSLTYLLRVVNAVSAERATSSEIAGLGPSPSEAVAEALAIPGLGTLPIQLVSIAAGLSAAAQEHLTLPMLQFFHTGRREASVALNVARYAEILALIEHALPDDHTPTVRAGIQAVDEFLVTIDLAETEPEPPPPPALEPLRAAGVEIDEAAFRSRVHEAGERRTRLRAFVEQEGWTWDDVVGPT